MLLAYLAGAQTWYPGSLVTADREVLVGDMGPYPLLDVIIVKTTSGTQVLKAHQIESCFYFHSVENRNVRWVSLPSGPDQPQRLFEVVLSGRVDVLRRPKPGSLDAQPGVLDHDYFTEDNDTITSMDEFRTRVFDGLIRRYPSEFQVFLQREKLNPNYLGDAIRIVQHFNEVDRRETTVVAQARL